MARILTIPAGKRAKFVVFAVFLLFSLIVGGAFSGKFGFAGVDPSLQRPA